ncbi:hypothetical protein [Klebsiella pneumoniae]|uniref:hypothetical protein n=1 Tax=Klebsiella pneumoniae TaxID=573 RepID=UPI00240D6AC4|nr:hypothetical protein [Klebsiella pneumoniae]WFA47254.1 hypothetical protein LVQ73_08990 [Klebsiella pneumoniae]
MTNITELAQSLKRRAASANEFGEGLFFIKADDVLALVEALEKAKSTIAEMDNRIRQQNRNICELFDDGKALRDRIAVLDSHAMMLSNIKNNVSG